MHILKGVQGGTWILKHDLHLFLDRDGSLFIGKLRNIFSLEIDAALRGFIHAHSGVGNRALARSGLAH
ncbi:hypothetical protein SDC9_181113 [bioreactor metagenome]|uniref:Uncharacterized protein n=1 Tax=bioreactor metagenome TaxID=1076179 RepID=A0A645HC08_9ZZZZ